MGPTSCKLVVRRKSSRSPEALRKAQAWVGFAGKLRSGSRGLKVAFHRALARGIGVFVWARTVPGRLYGDGFLSLSFLHSSMRGAVETRRRGG